MPTRSSACIVGYHNLMEAVQTGQPLAKVCIATQKRDERCKLLLQLLHERGVPVQRVPSAKLNRLTRQVHQGYVGLSSPVSFHALDKIIPSLFERAQFPFVLLVDRLTDARNFGAIVRTAAAVGVHAVVLPTKDSVCVQEDALKTSSGAIHHVSICRERSLQSTVRYLSATGLRIVACSEHAPTLYHEARLDGPIAVIVGGEAVGISPALLALSDEHVRMPMSGKVASLNVSVAFGVLAYEVLRQRNGT